MKKNKTWELVDKPAHKKAIGVKWILKTKFNHDGTVLKYKERLVFKGYSQQFGVDYNEIFALVSRHDTIRVVLALAASMACNIHQMDVKSAFLNGYLQEEIYVKQPLGFSAKGQEDRVLKLKKSLYGLKQTPRAWYSRINDYFEHEGFEKSLSEYTLYVK